MPSARAPCWAPPKPGRPVRQFGLRLVPALVVGLVSGLLGRSQCCDRISFFDLVLTLLVGTDRPSLLTIKVAATTIPIFLSWTPQHLVSGCARTLNDYGGRVPES